MKMRAILIPFLFAVVLLAAGCAARQPSTELADEEVARLLVGKWDLSEKEGLRSTTGSDWFRADGSFVSEALFASTGNRQMMATVSGRWKVQDGNLVETVERADPPLHDKGTVYRLRVISISASQLVTEGAGGVINTRKRLPER